MPGRIQPPLPEEISTSQSPLQLLSMLKAGRLNSMSKSMHIILERRVKRLDTSILYIKQRQGHKFLLDWFRQHSRGSGWNGCAACSRIGKGGLTSASIAYGVAVSPEEMWSLEGAGRIRGERFGGMDIIT